MDSTLDAHPDAEALALLVPYKAKVDSLMNTPLGTMETSIDRYRPESPLSNLIADVLREAALQVQEKPADVGIMNMGGIRNSLAKGTITMGNVYELLPFENSLCVLQLRGSHLKKLFENIALRLGEGISGARLVISPQGKLLEATVGGKAIEDERLYTVSTIDYLAEGNDGMAALLQAEGRVCPEGATIRRLFRDHVERQTELDKTVKARVEGRIIVK